MKIITIELLVDDVVIACHIALLFHNNRHILPDCVMNDAKKVILHANVRHRVDSR